jgi:hypothetical protein
MPLLYLFYLVSTIGPDIPKKTIVSIARRMAEMMYSMLRNRKEYEVRHWARSKSAVAPVSRESIRERVSGPGAVKGTKDFEKKSQNPLD